MGLAGTWFYKMCGSGNDFVFFDVRDLDPAELRAADTIRALCDRRSGVGADGVVLLSGGSGDADVEIVYYNSDGSRASLCGNATLCTARLVAALELADPAGFAIATDAGTLRARLRSDDRPEIDFQPLQILEPVAPVNPEDGEIRIGFAVAGVPHLVVQVDDVDAVDVPNRGRSLRFHARLPDGANVNFVSQIANGWRMRTYERGVEGETLACGTGAVASAAVLGSWHATAGSDTTLITSSSKPLVVRFDPSTRSPALSGEGRIVYEGRLGDFG